MGDAFLALFLRTEDFNVAAAAVRSASERRE